jgi:hypothetical protein
MGPYFDIALDVSGGGRETGRTYEWVNIGGVSDIKSLDADSLAPGATVHNEFCFVSAVWVVNINKETRRQIPVRGELRVGVAYFPTEETWQKNKQWYIENEGRPRAEKRPPVDTEPELARIFASIPCLDANCTSACVGAPKGIRGEDRAVPDVYYLNPEWNSRGKAISDDLARKSPPCSIEKSPVQESPRLNPD